jgi:tRNA (guanosine-2'-O-)-methyltransferase
VKSFKSEKRQQKILSVIKYRQFTLRVVLENIHDPHNVSAIFRTCDAAGVPLVSLIYNKESFPKIGKKSSASAFKWVEKEKFKSVEDCYGKLRSEGFEILASSISEDSVNLFDLDLTRKVAFVFGNEHRGVSEEAEKFADKKFLIPMSGMVQSLNVSVAAGIVLFEAFRQRKETGLYGINKENSEEILKMIRKWNKK